MFRTISSSRHADAITPTEPLGAVAVSPSGIGLPLNSGGSASATCPFRGLLGVHSRFGLPVRSITQGDFYQSTSTHVVTSLPLWLLPAERPIGRVGFAPTGDRRLSRRTEFLTRSGSVIKGVVCWQCHALTTYWKVYAERDRPSHQPPQTSVAPALAMASFKRVGTFSSGFDTRRSSSAEPMFDTFPAKRLRPLA